MADLSHESPDDAFHEIQLSGKQLVFLFMATTVVSVVIFLLGVVVGRSVRAEDIAVDAAVAAAANPPPAKSEPAAVPADAPVTPAEPALTYHERLESEKSPAEELKPKARPAAADASRPAAPAPDPQPPVPSPAAQGARPGTWAVQVQALRDRNAASQVVQRLRGKGYPAFVVAPTAGAPTQLFKIQVGRYNDMAEAQQVGARLKKELQFDAFVVR